MVNFQVYYVLDPGRVPKHYDIVVVDGVVVTVFEKCLRLS